jgi:hypothetical protein
LAGDFFASAFAGEVFVVDAFLVVADEAVTFFAGDFAVAASFLAGVFLAGAFLAVVFVAGALVAVVLVAGAFFVAVLAAPLAALVTEPVAFFAAVFAAPTAFFAGDFFADVLVGFAADAFVAVVFFAAGTCASWSVIARRFAGAPVGRGRPVRSPPAYDLGNIGPLRERKRARREAWGLRTRRRLHQ